MVTLPTLDPSDELLLAHYLHTGENLEQFLSASAAPTTDLVSILRFLARPDVAPWLTHYRTIQAHARQHAALNTLASLLRQTSDPTTLRLAATTLLQHSRTPRQPAPSRLDDSTPSRLDASMPSSLDAFPHINHAAPAATRGHAHPHNPPASAPASLAPQLHTDPYELAPLHNDVPSDNDHNTDHAAHQELSDDASEHTDHVAASAAPHLDRRAADDLRHRLEHQLKNHLHDQLPDQLQHELQDLLDDQLEDQLTAEAAANDPLLAAALTGDIDAINRLYIERTGAPPDPALAAALHTALAQPAPNTPSSFHGPHG